MFLPNLCLIYKYAAVQFPSKYTNQRYPRCLIHLIITREAHIVDRNENNFFNQFQLVLIDLKKTAGHISYVSL